MGNTQARADTREKAVAYLIDEEFVNKRTRHTNFVMAGAWLIVQVGLWVWYFSGEPKPMPWTHLLAVDLGCSAVLWCAGAIGGPWLAKKQHIILSETRMVVPTCWDGLRTIRLSREHPLVIRRSTSGKHWELISGGPRPKTVKVLYAAYTMLGPWAEEFGKGAVRFEHD